VASSKDPFTTSKWVGTHGTKETAFKWSMEQGGKDLVWRRIRERRGVKWGTGAMSKEHEGMEGGG